MSHSRKPSLDFLSDKPDKPDFRELDLGSPVSTLRARPGGLVMSTSTSSGSSSGSVTVRNVKKSDSGELSGESLGLSPTGKSSGGLTGGGSKTGHVRSNSASSPPVNVLPAGNICPSGRVLTSGIASSGRSSRPDVLGGSGTRHYGHGSIVRGGVGGGKKAGSGVDPEEVKRKGNEQYRKGNFSEALSLYDKAIKICPSNAAYRGNRAAALTGLAKLGEAVKECEEAVRLDPNYLRAHLRLGSLYIRLGNVESARKHLCIPGKETDQGEMHKLQAVEKHINKCANFRKVCDWRSALREADLAIACGADSSPQLFICRTEAFLKLHQLKDAESSWSDVHKLEPSIYSCSQDKFCAMLSEAYFFYVRAQFEMEFGRFDDAVAAVEKAAQIDPKNIDIAVLHKTVRLVANARERGNKLYKSERFTEACAAYSEGLRLDPSNSIIYCNRAACYFMLGQWEKSIDDCNEVLRIQPNYLKALHRRAAANRKLERWEDAVRDYEVLRKQCPDDNEIAEALFHVQVALKKSRGEEVYNMKFGGDVEEVSGLEHFRAVLSIPGVSVVHFKAASNMQCKQISPFVDTMCGRYPSISFLMVDVEKNPAVADAESVSIVPTFKIYKNGSRVKEIVCPSHDMLEHSVRHYSF